VLLRQWGVLLRLLRRLLRDCGSATDGTRQE
jgi:hypothetical protein